MAKDLAAIAAGLAEKFAGAVELLEDERQAAVQVSAESLPAVAGELRDNPDLNFRLLMDLTAVDYPENFQMVYHLLRLEDGETFKLVVPLEKENPRVPTLTGLWPAANVQERETYDLMGINFTGHPDLRRILLDENFSGHPLRKDYVVPSQRR